ncbi:hypothetical protein RLOatenuis_6960 [Rickettsiales bacterium]|nr:hypothetical protein RLOatenuis_6960 [Rickettsiales bacterium]
MQNYVQIPQNTLKMDVDKKGNERTSYVYYDFDPADYNCLEHEAERHRDPKVSR